MPETWRDTNYAHRKEITIQEDNLDGDLTNFPCHVVINADTDINTGTVQADLDDIRFYDSSGNLLKFEVEYYDIDGTDCNARIWVKKPALYTSPTGYDNTIWMYYGYGSATSGQDAANVWDAGYEAVWHLAESGNGTASEFVDSTANANHGTGGGGDSAKTPDQVTGMIGKGQDFVKANADYIVTGSIAHGIGTGDFCIDAWIKPDALPGNYCTVWSNGSYAPALYAPQSDGTNPAPWSASFYWGGNHNFATDMAAAWEHIAVVRRSGTVYLYRNGVEDATTFDLSGSSMSNAVSYLGWSSYGTELFDGLIDEARLTVGDRSATWLKFQYNNIAQADWEQTWAAEEDQPAGGALTGSTTLTFTATGTVAGKGALSGSSTLTFTPAGVLVGSGALVGSSSLTFSPSAAITAKGSLAGSSSLVFAATGALTGKGTVAGASSLTFAASGTLAGKGAVTGASSLTFAATGTLAGQAALSGSSSLTFTPAGSLSATGALVGSTSIDFTAAASLSSTGTLSGSTSLTFTPSAALTATGGLLGQATLTFTPTGNLLGSGLLAGQTTLTFTPAGVLSAGIPPTSSLIGSTSLIFTLAGLLHATGTIIGSTTLTFTPTGTIRRATSGPLRRGPAADDPRLHRQSSTGIAVLRRPSSTSGGPLRRHHE